jgi:hypothetical protein
MEEQLKRIADALFQQAKAMRISAKAAESQAALAEQMLELQQVNLRVTKALEQQLILSNQVSGQRSN